MSSGRCGVHCTGINVDICVLVLVSVCVCVLMQECANIYYQANMWKSPETRRFMAIYLQCLPACIYVCIYVCRARITRKSSTGLPRLSAVDFLSPLWHAPQRLRRLIWPGFVLHCYYCFCFFVLVIFSTFLQFYKAVFFSFFLLFSVFVIFFCSLK